VNRLFKKRNTTKLISCFQRFQNLINSIPHSDSQQTLHQCMYRLNRCLPKLKSLFSCLQNVTHYHLHSKHRTLSYAISSLQNLIHLDTGGLAYQGMNWQINWPLQLYPLPLTFLFCLTQTLEPNSKNTIHKSGLIITKKISTTTLATSA